MCCLLPPTPIDRCGRTDKDIRTNASSSSVLLDIRIASPHKARVEKKLAILAVPRGIHVDVLPLAFQSFCAGGRRGTRHETTATSSAHPSSIIHHHHPPSVRRPSSVSSIIHHPPSVHPLFTHGDGDPSERNICICVVEPWVRVCECVRVVSTEPS